jgi:hypothetical protein
MSLFLKSARRMSESRSPKSALALAAAVQAHFEFGGLRSAGAEEYAAPSYENSGADRGKTRGKSYFKNSDTHLVNIQDRLAGCISVL